MTADDNDDRAHEMNASDRNPIEPTTLSTSGEEPTPKDVTLFLEQIEAELEAVPLADDEAAVDRILKSAGLYRNLMDGRLTKSARPAGRIAGDDTALGSAGNDQILGSVGNDQVLVLDVDAIARTRDSEGSVDDQAPRD